MITTHYFDTEEQAQASWDWFRSNPVAYSVEPIRFSKSSEQYYFQVRKWSLD